MWQVRCYDLKSTAGCLMLEVKGNNGKWKRRGGCAPALKSDAVHVLLLKHRRYIHKPM
jgi:hypothetical protein